MNRPPWLTFELADFADMTFIPQIDSLREASGHALSLYTDEWIKAQADAARDDSWERAGHRPFEGDMADAVGDAEAAGFSRYTALNLARQTLLNVFVVALAHLLEQQQTIFGALPRPIRGSDSSSMPRTSHYMPELRQALHDLRVDDPEPEREAAVEIRLVSNVVKHGDGPAARALEKIRPDLWEVSDGKGPIEALTLPFHTGLTTPLPIAGVVIYVRDEDLNAYFSSARELWGKVVASIRNLSSSDK